MIDIVNFRIFIQTWRFVCLCFIFDQATMAQEQKFLDFQKTFNQTQAGSPQQVHKSSTCQLPFVQHIAQTQ